MGQLLFSISLLLLVSSLVFGIFLKHRTVGLYLFAGALSLKLIKEVFIREDWIAAATTLIFLCLILLLAKRK